MKRNQTIGFYLILPIIATALLTFLFYVLSLFSEIFSNLSLILLIITFSQLGLLLFFYNIVAIVILASYTIHAPIETYCFGKSFSFNRENCISSLYITNFLLSIFISTKFSDSLIWDEWAPIISTIYVIISSFLLYKIHNYIFKSCHKNPIKRLRRIRKILKTLRSYQIIANNQVYIFKINEVLKYLEAAENNYLAFKRNLIAEKKGGISNLTKKIGIKHFENLSYEYISNIIITDVAGKPIIGYSKLSLSEIVYMHLLCNNDKVFGKFQEKISKDSIIKLKNQFSLIIENNDTLKNFVSWCEKSYLPMLNNEIKKTYFELNGEEMEFFNNKYIPIFCKKSGKSFFANSEDYGLLFYTKDQRQHIKCKKFFGDYHDQCTEGNLSGTECSLVFIKKINYVLDVFTEAVINYTSFSLIDQKISNLIIDKTFENLIKSTTFSYLFDEILRFEISD